MACTGLALVISSPQEPLLQCALYLLVFNKVINTLEDKISCFDGLVYKVARSE